MEPMVAFNVVMDPLAKALGLSLAVERIIEFGKNFVEPRFLTPDTRAQPDPASAEQALGDVAALADRDEASRKVEEDAEAQAAERTAQSAELEQLRARLLTETDPAKRAKLQKQAVKLRASLAPHEQAGEWEERVPTSIIIVDDAKEQDDVQTLRTFVLQLLGLATGILMAGFTDLRLFTAFLATFLAPDPMPPGWVPFPGWVDHILTGLFIGGGSGPVHTLIRFLSERKTSVEAAELAVAEQPEQKAPTVRAAAPAPDAAAPAASANEHVDVPYEGGVDVDVLQSVHRRDADPDLVVYHHTAMSSESTFEDVVRVIKSRTDASGNHWLTAYNCVVLADGSIHAFCRWDRYGNHAVGYNRRSLGVSFNGNFETNPAVPFSNPDGRYGAPRPTDPQLRAGARVVALWTLLYPIPVDFAKSIIPHKQIASKACPGSNFPYEEFQQLVRFYRQTWQKSAVAKQQIAAFKLKPYLYT